jgi:hypothetical protein
MTEISITKPLFKLILIRPIFKLSLFNWYMTKLCLIYEMCVMVIDIVVLSKLLLKQSINLYCSEYRWYVYCDILLLLHCLPKILIVTFCPITIVTLSRITFTIPCNITINITNWLSTIQFINVFVCNLLLLENLGNISEALVYIWNR